MSECLINTIAGLQVCFQNTYFEEHLQPAASGGTSRVFCLQTIDIKKFLNYDYVFTDLKLVYEMTKQCLKDRKPTI